MVKKFVALLLVVIMLLSTALADGRSEIIEYLVELVNGYQLSFIEMCKYDEEADALLLEMSFEKPMSAYKSLSDADRAELTALYMQGHNVMIGGLEIADVETTTVSIAKSSDNVPFFLCVNGVDQSWLLEE